MIKDIPELNAGQPVVDGRGGMVQHFRTFLLLLARRINSGISKFAYSGPVTGDYTITDADFLINYESGTYTVTLPTAVGRAGQQYEIKNSGTGLITVDPDGTETIDDSLTKILRQYDAMMIMSDGANWIIV